MDYMNSDAKRLEEAMQCAQKVAEHGNSEAIVVRAVLDVVQHRYKKDVIQRKLQQALMAAYA